LARARGAERRPLFFGLPILRDVFTKLAFDLSTEYATPKLRAEIMIEGGFAASPSIDRVKEKPPLHEKWRLSGGVLALNP